MTVRLCDNVMGRYRHLKEGSLDFLKSDYHKNLLGIGEWRQFIYENKEIKARITGVNEYGHLMLDTESGDIECDMKEIRFVY